MSSFSGACLLAGTAAGLGTKVTMTPPDEPGLGQSRQIETQNSIITHRQRIVTPEDKSELQPWQAWGGQGWTAFAGRLDDRPTLRHALGLQDATDMPDGQLACRAFERWDENAPERMLGDFALAAWHEPQKRLLLAADPLGMRTVYYWRRQDLVLFATSLRGLLAAAQVPRTLNEPYLADFLAMNFGDDGATFYSQIRRVVPGTCAVLTPGRFQSVECHRFDPDRRLRLAHDRDYVEAARELLDQAVSDRMRAIKPIAISASGGLDSAAIAVSARSFGSPLKLLTAIPDPGAIAYVPRGIYTDERPFVAAMTARFPDLTVEFLAPDLHVDWSPGSPVAIATGATAFRNPAQIAWFDGIYRRAAALEAGAVLTGGGGNHTLTWNGFRSLPALLRQGRFLALARELVLGSGGRPRRMGRLVRNELLWPLRDGGFQPENMEDYSALSAGAREEFAIFERMREKGNDPQLNLSTDSRRLRIHLIRRARGRRADTENSLRGLHGLDSRTPLADLRLIEFCLAIPEDQFLKNGESRRLGRRLLRAAGVPRIIADNTLRGRQHPEWFAHLTAVRPSLPAQIARLRQSPTARRLIDLDRLEHMVADWPADAKAAERLRAQYSTLLNTALSVGNFIAWAESGA